MRIELVRSLSLKILRKRDTELLYIYRVYLLSRAINRKNNNSGRILIDDLRSYIITNFRKDETYNKIISNKYFTIFFNKSDSEYIYLRSLRDICKEYNIGYYTIVTIDDKWIRNSIDFRHILYAIGVYPFFNYYDNDSYKSINRQEIRYLTGYTKQQQINIEKRIGIDVIYSFVEMSREQVEHSERGIEHPSIREEDGVYTMQVANMYNTTRLGIRVIKRLWASILNIRFKQRYSRAFGDCYSLLPYVSNRDKESLNLISIPNTWSIRHIVTTRQIALLELIDIGYKKSLICNI